MSFDMPALPFLLGGRVSQDSLAFSGFRLPFFRFEFAR